MRRIALFAMLALAACGTSDHLAAYRYAGPQAPQTAGNQRPATAAEIEKAVTGSTLVAVNREGRRWVRYMKPGGYFTSYDFPDKPPATGRQWAFVRGVWRAADGRLCFRPEESRQEFCVKIMTASGVLHAYNEKDGLWQFSAELRPGNPFEL
ncbi:hypothetical protein [Azospirillum sp. sgz301742]